MYYYYLNVKNTLNHRHTYIIIVHSELQTTQNQFYNIK